MTMMIWKESCWQQVMEVQTVKIDKNEICRDYRQTKYKSEQVQILAELNAVDQEEVIDILIQSGEKVRIPLPGRGKKRTVDTMTDQQYVQAIAKRLDVLDNKIRPLEREYRVLAKVLNSLWYRT